MSSIERFDVGPRLSEMAIHNGVVYLAGQVPSDASADIQGQTEQVLAMIDQLLARAGSDKTKILRAQLYIADVKDLAGMNAAWDAWIPKGHTPARATVESKLATPAYQVEIMVEAAV